MDEFAGKNALICITKKDESVGKNGCTSLIDSGYMGMRYLLLELRPIWKGQ